MSQGHGIISSSDLMQKLVQAKKIMNKVDGGNYQRGNIDESSFITPTENLISEPSMGRENRNSQSMVVDENQIRRSKLPDAIKNAMIKNPIPQISLSDNLDMDILSGAKKIMEQQGLIKKQPTNNNIKNGPSSNVTFDMDTLSVLIENVVRKVMDEKLNSFLSSQQTTSINENLVLKVGDSIFKGKITGVNKSK